MVLTTFVRKPIRKKRTVRVELAYSQQLPREPHSYCHRTQVLSRIAPNIRGPGMEPMTRKAKDWTPNASVLCSSATVLQHRTTSVVYYSTRQQVLCTTAQDNKCCVSTAQDNKCCVLQHRTTSVVYYSTGQQVLCSTAQDNKCCVLQYRTTSVVFYSTGQQVLCTTAQDNKCCVLFVCRWVGSIVRSHLNITTSPGTSPMKAEERKRSRRMIVAAKYVHPLSHFPSTIEP